MDGAVPERDFAEEHGIAEQLFGMVIMIGDAGIIQESEEFIFIFDEAFAQAPENLIRRVRKLEILESEFDLTPVLFKASCVDFFLFILFGQLYGLLNKVFEFLAPNIHGVSRIRAFQSFFEFSQQMNQATLFGKSLEPIV